MGKQDGNVVESKGKKAKMKPFLTITDSIGRNLVRAHLLASARRSVLELGFELGPA